MTSAYFPPSPVSDSEPIEVQEYIHSPSPSEPFDIKATCASAVEPILPSHSDGCASTTPEGSPPTAPTLDQIKARRRPPPLDLSKCRRSPPALVQACQRPPVIARPQRTKPSYAHSRTRHERKEGKATNFIQGEVDIMSEAYPWLTLLSTEPLLQAYADDITALEATLDLIEAAKAKGHSYQSPWATVSKEIMKCDRGEPEASKEHKWSFDKPALWSPEEDDMMMIKEEEE